MPIQLKLYIFLQGQTGKDSLIDLGEEETPPTGLSSKFSGLGTYSYLYIASIDL